MVDVGRSTKHTEGGTGKKGRVVDVGIITECTKNPRVLEESFG